jgi:hypothetical protein
VSKVGGQCLADLALCEKLDPDLVKLNQDVVLTVRLKSSLEARLIQVART